MDAAHLPAQELACAPARTQTLGLFGLPGAIADRFFNRRHAHINLADAARYDKARLEQYNRLVLAFQDDVYDFAFSMLDDPAKADQVTQETFRSNYMHFSANRLDCFSTGLLKTAYQLAISELEGGTNNQGKPRPLMQLDPRERAALALVDRLGLDYAEAARVTGATTAEVTRRVASGRRRLAKIT